MLQEVFAKIEEGTRITVLDLGPGNADTLRFLSRYRARICFADLLDNPTLGTPVEGFDPSEYYSLMAQQLAVPEDARVDVCLLWDYLHYLDLPRIEILSSVLQPLLAKGARGYGFGSLHGKPPGDAHQYGVVDLDTVSTQPITTEHRYYGHPQQRLAEHFPVLQIARGTLLREGRLELLFEGV